MSVKWTKRSNRFGSAFVCVCVCVCVHKFATASMRSLALFDFLLWPNRRVSTRIAVQEQTKPVQRSIVYFMLILYILTSPGSVYSLICLLFYPCHSLTLSRWTERPWRLLKTARVRRKRRFVLPCCADLSLNTPPEGLYEREMAATKTLAPPPPSPLFSLFICISNV